MIIDSHSHLHDEKFADDLDQVLARAQQAGISHMVSIGCDIPTTTNARKLAHSLPHVYFSAGFHPHEAKFLTEQSLAELKQLAKDPKCVAIGECGLDYFYNHSNQEEQRHAFIKQIELATELNKPLVIHLRDAHEDCIKILKEHRTAGQKVVIHCFSGTADEAKEFQELDCFISISGIITFKKPGALPEVARVIPLNRLIIETDCPYLSPHPFRGQRNEPAYIVHTLNAVAQARGQNVAKVEEAIHQTTLNFFGFAN